MNTIFKTALASFAALWTMNLAAYAQVPAHAEAVDTAAILQNIYAEMDRTRAETKVLVLASAETRIEARAFNAEPLPMHRPLLNTFAQAHLAE